ncbi:MAG: winged helix-turn-helix domain-containing protein [Solirubrobacterales bacterium]|nr:winged helix-turn-helix domain-containing protein [Solirubrobacterales bacterium]
MVEFRILGPFEVVEHGQQLTLGGRKQKALLAVLLLHRGEVVSTDRLIEELWGERPPVTAAKTVHVYVSNLRRALGDGLLITHGRGYMLEAGPGHVDLDRFDALVDEGRRALAADDAPVAAERLRDALALWRGPPLPEFAYDSFAQNEIGRMEEARQVALEDRIDADLALGEAAALVGELETLVAANPLRERLRAQLMLALYRSGRQADALEAYRQGSQLLREGLGLEPGRELRELEAAILAQDRALDVTARLATATSEPSVPVCPFKGLAFFDHSDAEFFYGRERLISELVARCAESTMVGILGPSGIGKSSLLRAGLLPALSAGALPGSAAWRQVVMRPGKHPEVELARALGGDGLAAALARLARGARIVLAVDQLEELFTVCEGEEERAAFLDRLAATARDHARRALVVAALRADFYGQLSSHARFAELLSASHVLVGPLDRDELTQAIEQPAARAGLEIERPLVDELVSAVVGEPGGLPLLSTTLLELWRGRDGRAMRYESYRRSGGVRGAIGRLAESAYESLDERERPVSRRVLLRLASGGDGALARRPVPLVELSRIEGAESVIRDLTEARLLTVGDGHVELSHEALLHEWPRYRTWLEEDRGGRRLHTRLTAAASEWDAEGRDPGELYRGARLAGVLEWSAQHRDELAALEREFISASKRRAEREARRLRWILAGVIALLLVSLVAGAVALIQKQHATSQARVALARQLAADAVNEPRADFAMLLARQAVNLDRSPSTEESLLQTLLQSPELSGSFAQPAGSPTAVAVSPTGHTLLAADLEAGEIHFYDTRTRAMRRVHVTDLSGGQPPAYSADGSLLTYLTSTGVAVRNASTLALLRMLPFDSVWLTHPAETDVPGGVQLAPDRRRASLGYTLLDIAGNPTAAYVDRWSLPDGVPISTNRIGSGTVLAARLVDAGTRLVTLDAHGVTVFEAHSMRRMRSIALGPAQASPSAAAISPDGRTVAIGSVTGSVYFLNLSNARARPASTGHAGAVSQVLYSEDGRSVVTVGQDNQVIVWDPNTATPVQALAVRSGQVESAALSRDMKTLYTSSRDTGLLEWDLGGAAGFRHHAHISAPATGCCDVVSPPTPPMAVSGDGLRIAAVLSPATVGIFTSRTFQHLATLTPGNIGVTGLAWSPSGSDLVIAGHAGVVQLWSLAGPPREIRSFTGLQASVGPTDAVESVAFSRDGALIAASDLAESPATPGIPQPPFATVAVWRTETGALIAPIRDVGDGYPVALAFSPTAKLLAVSLGGADVLILNTSTGQATRTLHPNAINTTMAFAPDGTLAIGSAAGSVELWNPTTGRRVSSPILVASAEVASIAFDPSDQQFATAGWHEGTAKLWLTSTLAQEGTALHTDQDTSATLAFSAGPNLLAADDAGNVLAWPTSLAAWEQQACAVAGRDFTHQEWARYANGHAYVPACPRGA